MGKVRFGDLRRFTPIDLDFGFERGQPIDRYYIEKFIQAHAGDIKGRVLEFYDNNYTVKFGKDRVLKSDVMNLDAKRRATIVGDLTKADFIPSESFDCIICTQTLFFMYDFRAAIRHLYRILKSGGVLLVTVPGISQRADHQGEDSWVDYWRFTKVSARLPFEETFLPEQITVQSRGNIFAATSFLYGLAVEEVKPEEFEYQDPNFEVIISIRAVKS